MFNYFLLILLTNFIISTTCLIIHTQRSKDHQEICIKNYFQNNLRVCYLNNNRNRSILVWFIIDNTLLDLFHLYRFILRSIDEISLSTLNIHILTNFTELIDLNNSLRILNLDTGQYEICIDFQSNITSYVYSPRNSCISIRIGELLHRSFKQSSIQLFIALISGIILFLILGLVVQWIKTKRIDNQQDDKKIKEDPEQRSRSSSILTTVSLKKQRGRIVRKLFRNHIDQPDDSQMRQWARNRAFRHRISTQEQEIQCTRSIQRRNQQISTNDIYTIPYNASSYSTLSEEFELL